MSKLYRVLIVCTGNVCRSPMAEGFLAGLVREQKLDHVQVESAGVHALDGCTPTDLAVAAAAELGADVQAYTAATITREQVLETDLILVMEKRHEEILTEWWPEEIREKVKLIRSFHPNNPTNEDVIDPMGATLTFYQNTAHLLMACCYGVIRHLQEV